MRKLLTLFFFCALASNAISNVSAAHAEAELVVPIRFHIVKNMPMKKDGLTMRSWVSRADIISTILPEVNRIWRPASISFVEEKTLHSAAREHPKKAALIEFIVNSRRDSQGKSNPKRIKKLKKLIDWEQHNPDAINIYFVPYLGERSQGNAKRKRRRIFLAQWTDKASKAKKLPEKFQLVETRPFQKGSLSRTLAHEIGHILGLKHPNESNQTEFQLLMGGQKRPDIASLRWKSKSRETELKDLQSAQNDYLCCTTEQAIRATPQTSSSQY